MSYNCMGFTQITFLITKVELLESIRPLYYYYSSHVWFISEHHQNMVISVGLCHICICNSIFQTHMNTT